MADLGAGERDAILLARELSADLVLMDDRSGRAEARRQQVVTTGTLGVLESAAMRGLLHLPEALSRLLETNFHVDQSLIDDLLERDARRRDEPETETGENGDHETH
jgi:predicted nucleic acid-binding protein